MKLLLELFFVFFKVAITTFGGGYAMLPILKNETIKKRGWITESELLDYYAISQCTPGIIGVNVATFVGYKHKGKFGALVATLGLIAPSILLVTIASFLLREFIHNSYVVSALRGVRILMVALIFYTVFDLGKKSIIDFNTAFIFTLTGILMYFFDVHIIVLIVIAIVLGNLLTSKHKGTK